MAVSAAFGLTILGTGSVWLTPIAPSRAGLEARVDLEVRPDSAGLRLLAAENPSAAVKQVVAQKQGVAEKQGRVRSLQRSAAARVIARSAEFKTAALRACKATMDSPAWVTPTSAEVVVDSAAVAEDSAEVEAEPVVVEAAEAGGKL